MRDEIIERMYELSSVPYAKLVKKQAPWNISQKEFLQYPDDSLGYHLGLFLKKYNLTIQPKLEDHDIFHILTNTGITVTDEICLQFYLLGNGKRSLYLLMVAGIGALFYPLQIKLFKTSYKRGKKAFRFYDLNFIKMLNLPIQDIQNTFSII